MIGTRRARFGDKRQLYLLRDEFRNSLAAGAVNGTGAEPGPGIRTLTDPESKVTVAEEEFIWAKHLLADGDNSWLSYSDKPISRIAGRVIAFTTQLTAAGQFYISLSVNTDEPIAGSERIQYRCQGAGVVTRFLTNNAHNVNLADNYPALNINDTRVIVLRGSGAYFFKLDTDGNWKLVIFRGDGSVSPLYLQWSNFGSLALASAGKISYIRIPKALWLPRPLAYDTFTRSNGALGNTETSGPDSQDVVARAWTGATWAIDTNQSKNTPTDTEISPNNVSVSDSQTEGNAITGYVAGGGGTLASDGTQQQAGSYSFKLDGAVSPTFRPGSIMTIGNWYSMDYYYLVLGGESITYLRNRSGEDGSLVFVENSPTIGSWTRVLVTFRADHSNASQGWVRFETNTISDAVFFDNLQLQTLTLSTLFASLESSVADILIDIDIAVDPAGTQAGVVMNLDDVATPANFVIAYHDGTNAILEKCVAGTYTGVISAAAAFSADATLRVIKDGTSYSLYWNNVQVGTTQTISDAGIVDNTIHGMFSTLAANRLDNFQVFPRGTNGEYNRLDKF